MRQSQLVANNSASRLMFLGHVCAAVKPTALDNGNQNTEKP
jgi:hypothetical protein